jgi:replicative DNA helicase
VEKAKRSKTYEPVHDHRKPREQAKGGKKTFSGVKTESRDLDPMTRGLTTGSKENTNAQIIAFFSLKSLEVQERLSHLEMY